jgi:plastocyanin
MAFNPSTINVKVGSTITWTNKDNMAHTVTADDNSFNSGSMNQGDTFKYTFNAAGTFKYHCVYHSNMLASVVVTQ